MPFLCGIDEVGYGPRLGPLVVTAVAFEVPDSGLDLWRALRVAKNPSKTKVAVCDSKRLYHAPQLGPLERTALAFWRAGEGTAHACFGEFAAAHCAHGLDAAREQPWFREIAAPLPMAAEEVPDLRAALEKAGVRLAGVRSVVADAREYNEGVARLGNKSDFLFEVSGRLYRWIWELAQGECTVVVGKQGGRSFYADRLQALFGEAFVMTSQEDAHLSVYSVDAGRGRRMRMAFAADAEDRYFAVGLASILAKYTREGLMQAFNRWWCGRVPGLRPTAGYSADADRFLKETERYRREEGVDDRVLVRSR